MGYSMSRERKRARINFLRKVIAVLFLCCVVLLIADIVCMIVLINGGKKSKKTTSDTSATIESSVDPSASDAESETTPPTETTPAPVEVKEYLPENALAESYWGPLPEVTEVKPVQHNDVRGIYIAAAMRLDENIELASRSDINAFVIDLKDEGGGILYNSDIQFAKDMKLYNYKCNKDGSDPSWEDKGSYVQNAYNLDSIVEKCHQNGIKVIGRIVCFNDLSLARNHPEMSIVDANGNTMRFKLEGYKQFVNPYDTKVWDFLIEIAQEAISKGVDEIQFDYVRFPTISTKSGEAPYFGPEDTTPTRIDAINRFLQTARRKIQDPTGIPVTADVFGIILSSELSCPTLVALISKVPNWLTVPDITSSPTVLSTGTDSPVIMDWSMDVVPLIMTPSTGIDSPATTLRMSPSLTSSASTILSSPSAIMRAVFGFMSMSLLMFLFALSAV